MSLANTRSLTQEQYQDLLFRLLSQVEGSRPKPYCDTNSAHIPSIGIGFNLTIEKVRNEVFDAMGITDTTVRAHLLSVINDKTIRSLPTERTRNNALQNALDETLGKPFVMTDEQMLSVFALESASHTSFVKNSADIEYSQELAALVSAGYTGVYGPSLKAALASGDRAEAWYQIRYESNADNAHGKRRYIESELFGLTAETRTPDDVFNAYRMLNLHRNKILQYEKKYSNLIDDAQEDIKAAKIDNLTVPTLEEALNSIRDSLITILQANYASLDGKDLSSYQSTSIYLDPNRNNAKEQLNPDHAATLNARKKDASGDEIASNDILIGVGGDDTLEGGKGDDILIGGQGFDTYIWRTGDGTDTIIDEDLQGVIKINSGTPKELFATGIFLETEQDSGIWTQVTEDGSVLTLTNNGLWGLVTAEGTEIILGKDWQNGDFGIHLQNVLKPSSIGLTLIGDLAPIDFDLNVEGIQTEVDDLLNIRANENTIEANRGDTIYDSTGNDRLKGLGGQDVLDANRGGNDILEGGADSDALLGGSGDDQLYGASEEKFDVLLAAGETGAGTGQRGDLMAGGIGNDGLYGGNGNDALAGGDGSDTLEGGLGDDVLLGDDDFFNAGANWNVIQKHIPNEQGGLAHSFEVVGSGYQHLKQGGDDLIYGGAGADLVYAGFGNDTIEAGNDNDVVFGDAGNDVIKGQSGNDILIGDGYGDTPYGNDNIFGGDGNDWLYGTGGDDYLDGGDGRDVLFGDHNGGNINADGEDILNGGLGDDTLFGGGNDDALSGNSGNDTLYGEAGNDYLGGSDGDDKLYGGDGADILDGGAGINILFGQDGNDLIFGGFGTDILSGDAGDDSYFTKVSSNTQIKDYVGFNSLFIDSNNAVTGAYTLSTDSKTGNVLIVNPDESSIVIDKALFGTQMSISSDDGELDIVSLREWVGTNFNSSVNFTVLTENGDVYGGNASDKLAGLSGNNTIWGGGGDDEISGKGGEDTLYGDAGNDILDGGAGDDILKGNEGWDSYILKAGNNGLDKLWEQEGESSTIKLEGIEFSDLVDKQDGNDLVLNVLGDTQGLVIKDYFIQSHNWIVQDYSGTASQLSEVLNKNNSRRLMLDQVARLKEEFLTSWRNEMAAELLAAKAIQLTDGRFEQKPEINFYYNQSIRTPSSASPNSEYGWIQVSNWTTTSLGIKTLEIGDLSNIGGNIWGRENHYYNSVQDLQLDQWSINQSSQDYDQYSYQWVFKSEFITAPPGAGFNIPDSVNLRFSPTDEPGVYLATWNEYQKIFNYHEQIIAINGHASIVSALPALDGQKQSAQLLGHQVLDGQALPDHLVFNRVMQEVALSAIEVEGSDGNDNITFGSDYAQIIHGKGGDDVINIRFFNEGPFAKGFLDGDDGNDALLGGYNDDILIGGNGADYLQGDYGSDRYIVSGVGLDFINPQQDGNGWFGVQTDVIVLPEGITPNMLSTQYGTAYFDNGQITSEPDTLNLNWLGKTQVMVALPFAPPNANSADNSFDHVVFQFFDGKVVTLESLLLSTQAADSRPFIWSESLSGNEAEVEWRIPLWAAEFSLGMGNFAVYDYAGGIEFDENISVEDVRYLKSGNDLLVTLASGSDSLRLQDWYLRIDAPEARFGDGQIWSYDDLSNEGISLSGTEQADSMEAADDFGWHLLGLAGDDILKGGDGIDFLIGGAGNDTLIGRAGSDILMGGAGNDLFIVESRESGFKRGAGFDSILGGAGNDIIRVKDFQRANSVEKIDGGLGVNRIVGSQLDDIIDLSATKVVNIASIDGRAGSDKIIGSSSSDTLDGGPGDDLMIGDKGNDTYILGRGYGVDTVIENDTTVGDADTIQFLSDILFDQIWFGRTNNNLEVSIMGTETKMTINDWYLDSANHVEQFRSSDGKVLLDNQVETLVTAMSAFNPPAAGQMVLPMQYEKILSPIIAANWH